MYKVTAWVDKNAQELLGKHVKIGYLMFVNNLISEYPDQLDGWQDDLPLVSCSLGWKVIWGVIQMALR